jgi:hypothetical protein
VSSQGKRPRPCYQGTSHIKQDHESDEKKSNVPFPYPSAGPCMRTALLRYGTPSRARSRSHGGSVRRVCQPAHDGNVSMNTMVMSSPRLSPKVESSSKFHPNLSISRPLEKSKPNLNVNMNIYSQNIQPHLPSSQLQPPRLQAPSTSPHPSGSACSYAHMAQRRSGHMTGAPGRRPGRRKGRSEGGEWVRSSHHCHHCHHHRGMMMS